MFQKTLICISLSVAAAAAFALVGCNRSEPSAPQGGAAQSSEHGDAPATPGEHGHAAGAHGGTIVPIGRDSYHAEVVFENGGTIRLFTLGSDEAKVQEVEAQTLAGFVKRRDATDSV